MQCETCPRGLTDCHPLNNVVSDDEPRSFICAGYSDPATRTHKPDRFRYCWKNQIVDERGDWDRRDILDTLSVLTTALSIDANIQTGEGMTDDDMNQTDFRPIFERG